MWERVIIAIVLLVISRTLPAQESGAKGTPELVVHLLDYLAKDYGGAVQDGKIVSESEYAEQVEFANIVEQNSRNVADLSSDATFMDGIAQLKSTILIKGSSADVSALARHLQQNAIQLAHIQVEPAAWPNLDRGEILFKENCATCHGVEGRGDGIAGVGLDPAPADFHNQDLVWSSAPYKFFNTIRLGVPGTGMAAFSALSDQDAWALAFYLKALPYHTIHQESNDLPKFSLKELAVLTDEEIVSRLGGKTQANIDVIGTLRSRLATGDAKDQLSIAEELIASSVTASQSGDFGSAEKLALRAYLEGIEPLEPKMKANIPGSVEKLEGLMSAYRSLLAERNPSAIESKGQEIAAAIGQVRGALGENVMSPGIAFGAAFSIFLREGFEAVLIIIVLISILRAMNQPVAVKWVHGGWIAALATGVIGWFASGYLVSMSGVSREVLEGAIALLAVAVLTYVGFWLHRYSAIKKWRSFLETKLKNGLSKGSFASLAFIAFIAVFREAFEVVLFLRAIWIDLDPSGQTVAGMGVLSSFATLVAISYFAVKRSKRLPLGYLFKICSWTMFALAFILAGKGIHALQEAGYVSVSSVIPYLRIDTLGIYPSWETLSSQLALVSLLLIVWMIERRGNESV